MKQLSILPLLPSFSPTMLTLLGRSALSSALRLSPIYRTPLVYPVDRDHRTPGYRTPTFARAYGTSDGGDDYEDFGPIPPIILYTDGIRGSPEQGSHMGIGIFVDDDHELNLCQPIMGKKGNSGISSKTPELQVGKGGDRMDTAEWITAIRVALFRLYKWPSFLMEDVIIRTQYDSVADEFEKWRSGDLDGSRSMQDVWRMMDRFPNVVVFKPPPVHLRHSQKFPLSLTTTKKDDKKDDE
ncbi:hypothetical protein PRIPAC_74324 [Pristionchus pacificus]|uniref:Uncharacterized protein n=1 Tax=Pristionchus pacificus TaxID=54126 RepID=A0A2A6CRH4_PRIPA|nr:hypothetical protein PRIPAC_74324 [Pristionchus pacificus]|eukprot:PDM80720.1 hypothetical protein PRIPAC_35723 [Pristionchus pacificus]